MQYMGQKREIALGIFFVDDGSITTEQDREDALLARTGLYLTLFRPRSTDGAKALNSLSSATG